MRPSPIDRCVLRNCNNIYVITCQFLGDHIDKQSFHTQYYPVLNGPCHHFVIDDDNKNNFTVDNMESNIGIL